MPALNVTACCSAIPTSKVLSGITSIIIPSELPVNIAGVTPTILLSAFASSMMLFPKTSWNLGGLGVSSELPPIGAPVSLSNKPGACHFVALPISAGSYPAPLRVMT